MAVRGNPVRTMMDDGRTRRRGGLQFFSDIYGELVKSTWPSRDEAVRLTLLVLGVSVALAAFLFLWDYGFTQLVQRLLL